MMWNPLKLCSARTVVRSSLELELLEDRRLLSTNVLTYHNDLARDGDNLTETTLTPSNVNMNTFGLLFSYPVDGQVYAQPLYMSNVTLADGSVHNIVFVETEHDSVYAFDANNPTAGPNGNGILWQDSFIDPANGITTIASADVNCGVISPEIGITDTPVIDPSTDIMYFVAATKATASDGTVTFHQQLHALDIRTGNEVLGGPVEIQAADLGKGDGGTIETFDPKAELERDGLVLDNGVVYTTWTSHCDATPVHGWIIGYDAHTLQQVVVFNTSPNSQLATIWAGAPAVDANGDLYFVTGNGPFTGGSFNPSAGDYPETVLHLSSATGQLTVADYFTPYNWNALDQADEDFGSGQVMLLPNQPGPVPHLLVAAGKEGKIYLINRDNMGQFNAEQDNIVQEVPNAILGNGEYGSPTYFDTGVPDGRYIYFAGWNDSLRAFQLFDNGTLSTSSVSQSRNVFSPSHGATPSLSANGTADGIIWAIDPSSLNAVLYAYDATNVANELYDSNQAGSRDQLDAGVKFSVPTIADGEVFVGTADSLSIFGLLPGGGAAGARNGRTPSLPDADLAMLLGSLSSRNIASSSVPGRGVTTGQANPLPSPAAQQPLPVPSSPAGSSSAVQTASADRFTKDMLFAGTQGPLQGLETAQDLAMPAFDSLAQSQELR
jgi:hypothetical protein